MSLSRTLQYAFIAIIVATVGFSLYQWNASRAALTVTQKSAPGNGLVGYWSFDDGAGTQAGDASGNNNTGTLTNGPTWVSGKLGQAINLDGINDYVDLGSVSTEATDYTVALWYKDGGSGGNIFHRGRSSGCCYNPLFSVGGGSWTPVESGCGNAGVLNVVSYPSGWNHLVMTRSGQTAKSYLNGVLQQTDSSQPGALGCNSGKILIGAGYQSNSPDVFYSYSGGSVDEVRIYNRALSGTEVTNLYNLGTEKLNVSPTPSSTSGLVGWWTFDGNDMTSTLAYDKSGQGNTGTLTNSPTKTIGYLGQGLSFDGTDDYATIPDNATLDAGDTTNLTLTGWFYRNSATTDDTIIAKRNGIANTDDGYILYIDDATDKLTFETSEISGTDEYQLASTTTFTTPDWHHYAVVWDQASAGNTEIYLNGVTDGATDTGTIGNIGDLSNALTLNIGSESDNGNPFDGKLDETRIYNRALSASEIASLYNTGRVVLNSTKKIYITTPGAGTFSAPADWPGTADKVEVIGGGAAGGVGASYNSYPGAGGGGGAYAKKSNLAISNGASLQVGSGGSGGNGAAGGDTWIVSTGTVKAVGAPVHATNVAGTGGAAGSSVGDLVYSGGNGGSVLSTYSIGGGGGGGAAGPGGAGKNGGNSARGGCCEISGGGGGGGAGGGSSTAGSNSGTGDSAGAPGGKAQDNTAGGTANNNGSHGSGGGGGWNGTAGGNGGNGVEFDSTHGAGGGGGGGGAGGSSYYGGVGGLGANYGGGGGGGGQDGHGGYNAGGNGGNGIIVITYTPL